MYRLTTRAYDTQLFVHTVKAKSRYSWNAARILSVRETTGRAKKFMTRDTAQQFLDHIRLAHKYFEQTPLTKYEFEDANRNTFIVSEDITEYEWEIEAIHDESRLTHDELCSIACIFLREQGCAVLVNQPGSLPNGESPDAIGFHGPRQSHVVEAKTSRADFLSDASKPFRSTPSQGTGVYRWYLCEPELISPDELPKHWGLIYAVKGMRTVIVEAFPQERDKDSEIYLLYNTARRGIGGREQPKGEEV